MKSKILCQCGKGYAGRIASIAGSILLPIWVLLLLPAASRGEVIALKAKDTVTALEMNHGDTLHFQLRNGQTRTLLLEDTAVHIMERVSPGGVVYQFRCRFRIDGQPVELVRYTCTQEAFYEPYVINGVRIWPDTVKKVFDLIPIRHPLNEATGVRVPKKGNMDAMPRKDARLVVQDATLRVCPDQMQPWTDDPRDFIDVARCYGGNDTHLGAYFGKLCHVGLDINQPKGSPLFAPIDFDTQAYYDSLKMGGNNNRWRGIRRWQNGDVWALQTSHLIDLLVPEHKPLNKGTQYATSAGVRTGSHEHTHFDFRIGRPRPGRPGNSAKASIAVPVDFSDESEAAEKDPNVLILDAWIIWWQICEDLKAREGRIAADMQPPSPAQTGQLVTFSSRGSRSGSASVEAKYYWTFGDGGWATGPTSTHRYGRPGAYPVTLVVSSGNQRATRTMHLTVGGEPVAEPLLALWCDETSFRLRPAYAADVYGGRVGDIPHTVRIRTYPGAGRPQPRVVQARNLGGGTLSKAGSLRIEYETGDKWLKVIPSAEGNDQLFAVAVEPVGLEAGKTYSAIVNVGCGSAMNSPQGFRVELKVLAQGPAADQIIDDRDADFYATPYFWVGHRFSRCKPEHRGYGGFYLTNGGRPSPGEFVRFSPYLASGKYRVLLTEQTRLPSGSEFNAHIRHAEGESIVRINPTQARLLGTFRFDEAKLGFVQLHAADSTGLIVADAIQFSRVEDEGEGVTH